MPTTRAAGSSITRDQLAGKEMQVGRYYLERREYVAAINRFKVVVVEYQDTRHVEEALERLVEANLALGLVSEAQTAAAVLGHNFPDSPWYKDAYTLLQTEAASTPREQWRRGSVPRSARQASVAPGGTCSSPLRSATLSSSTGSPSISSSGLTVLTGETGAGKSILLDALSLALGGRGDSALVRHGAAQGDVTAVFDVGARPSRRARILGESGIDAEGDLILRRVQGSDGRSRAFINDQPVSATLLRQVGAGAGRDPRPARRPGDGRAGRAPRAPRRVRRPRGRRPPTSPPTYRAWREAERTVAELQGAHRGGADRGGLSPRRGRRAAASSRRRPAKRTRSPTGASA